MKALVAVGLTLASAAFAGVILIEQRDGGSRDERFPLSAAGPVTPISGGVPPPKPDPAAIATILGRPLFEAGRRPVTVRIAPDAAMADLPRLTGLLVTPNGRRAIFAGAPGGRAIAAAEGTRIGSFVVQSINAAGAVVLGPDGVRAIRPAFDRSGSSPDGPGTAPIAVAPTGAALLPQRPLTRFRGG